MTNVWVAETHSNFLVISGLVDTSEQNSFFKPFLSLLLLTDRFFGDV